MTPPLPTPQARPRLCATVSIVRLCVLQAALSLTEEQQVDLMLLRRLFYGKLGALRRERKTLLQQVPTGATETASDASSRLATIMTAAQQLHDNSAAEFKAFMQLTVAYRRGVLTHFILANFSFGCSTALRNKTVERADTAFKINFDSNSQLHVVPTIQDVCACCGAASAWLKSILHMHVTVQIRQLGLLDTLGLKQH